MTKKTVNMSFSEQTIVPYQAQNIAKVFDRWQENPVTQALQAAHNFHLVTGSHVVGMDSSIVVGAIVPTWDNLSAEAAEIAQIIDPTESTDWIDKVILQIGEFIHNFDEPKTAFVAFDGPAGMYAVNAVYLGGGAVWYQGGQTGQALSLSMFSEMLNNKKFFYHKTLRRDLLRNRARSLWGYNMWFPRIESEEVVMGVPLKRIHEDGMTRTIIND